MDEQLKQVQTSIAGHKIARRSVLVGAAWTVPAVVVGTAVPAWAGLSQTQPPVEITNVVCCKFSSENVYHFELTWTSNQALLYTTVSNLQFLLQPSSGTSPAMPVPPPWTFGPVGSSTASKVLVANSAVSTNSASFELYYQYDYTRYTDAALTNQYDTGHYPTPAQSPNYPWSPQVGTFNNTPDCNAVKTDQYPNLNTASTTWWV